MSTKKGKAYTFSWMQRVTIKQERPKLFGIFKRKPIEVTGWVRVGLAFHGDKGTVRRMSRATPLAGATVSAAQITEGAE